MFFRDIDHIKDKVDMLNDWHNEVNVTLAKLQQELEWIAWGIRVIMIAIVGTLVSGIISSLHPLH